MLNGSGRGSGIALEAYDRRLALLANAGIDLERVTFSAEFGRTLAYYTGLVFEVHAKAHRTESPIAAGGRYDGLMRAAGAGIDVAGRRRGHSLPSVFGDAVTGRCAMSR